MIALITWRSVHFSETGWGSASAALPSGAWFDRLRDELYTGTRPLLPKVFDRLPVALLVRLDPP